MKIRVTSILGLASILTACSGGCFGMDEDAPPADERLADEWEVDGESYSTETGFVEPDIVRTGSDADFEVYLPPRTVEVFATTAADSLTECLYDYPCEPGPKWTPLEFDSESKSWVGAVPVAEGLERDWNTGATPEATVIYRARETRFAILSKPIVIDSDSDNLTWVSTPEQVSELCTSEPCVVLEDLYVSKWEASDLAGLSEIDAVSGDLIITGNDNLTSLAGIEDLILEEGLTVADNPRLASLDALGSELQVSGVWFANLPALTEPITFTYELPTSRDRSRVPTFGFGGVPLASDHFASLPTGVDVYLAGELDTTLLTGGEGELLGEIRVRETDVERLELPAAAYSSVTENAELRSVVLFQNPFDGRRQVGISTNPKLETIELPTEGRTTLNVNNAPELTTIEGLENLGPESVVNLNDLPKLKRCEVEAALPDAVLQNATLDGLAECGATR